MEKSLRKSREDQMFLGVCGGIAEYLKIDSSIVRILTVLFAILGGPGLLVYIIAAIIMKPAY